MHTWPDIIQRKSQKEVPHKDTRSYIAAKNIDGPHRQVGKKLYRCGEAT
jgi:hypothetical protein